jgi:hypothetical protein
MAGDGYAAMGIGGNAVVLVVAIWSSRWPEKRTSGPGRGEASGSVFPPAVLSPLLRQLSHTTDPNKAPTPAVSAIASAPPKRDA